MTGDGAQVHAGTVGGTRTTFCGWHLPVSCSWLS